MALAKKNKTKQNKTNKQTKKMVCVGLPDRPEKMSGLTIDAIFAIRINFTTKSFYNLLNT